MTLLNVIKVSGLLTATSNFLGHCAAAKIVRVLNSGCKQYVESCPDIPIRLRVCVLRAKTQMVPVEHLLSRWNGPVDLNCWSIVQNAASRWIHYLLANERGIRRLRSLEISNIHSGGQNFFLIAGEFLHRCPKLEALTLTGKQNITSMALIGDRSTGMMKTGLRIL